MKHIKDITKDSRIHCYDSYEYVDEDAIILELYGINGSVHRSLEAKEIVETDITICVMPDLESHQLSYVLEYMNKSVSSFGIFVINKSCVIGNSSCWKNFLKYIHVNKIYDIGKYNSDNEKLILICSQIGDESNTLYYDMKQLCSPLEEISYGVLLDYYTNKIPAKKYDLTCQQYDWLQIESTPDEIIKHVMNELSSNGYIKCLLTQNQFNEYNKMLTKQVANIQLKKKRLTNLMLRVEPTMYSIPKYNTHGNIPLYDNMFNIIDYIDVDTPSLPCGKYFTTNTHGKYIIPQTPCCLPNENIIVFEIIEMLTDIDFLIISYQLSKYKSVDLDEDNISVYITM